MKNEIESTKTTPLLGSNGIPLFDEFKKLTGLDDTDLSFRTRSNKDLRPRDSKLFYTKPGKEDVYIPYFTIEGAPAQYAKGKKLLDYVRIRVANPDPGQGKYKQPYKSGTLPYFTKGLIEKYKRGDIIKILFLVEGEKKALAGWKKLSLDIAAISGIHCIKDSEFANQLHTDLEKLIEKCKVEKIVLCFDADARSCNYNKGKPDKDLYRRLYGFYTSVTKLKELLAPKSLDLYLFTIKQQFINEGKGLDDLLLLHEVNMSALRDELLKLTTGEKKYTDWAPVSGSSDSKLKKFFGLDSVDTFYEIYKHELTDNIFRWCRKDYKFDGSKINLIKCKENYKIFWKPIKDKDGNTKGCTIDRYKLIEFLRISGFRRFDVYQEDFIFILIRNNLIEKVSCTQIQDFVLSCVDKLGDGFLPNNVTKEDIQSKIHANPQSYFAKNRLSLLRTEKLSVHKDQNDKCFVYFLNGFVEITKDKITLRPYHELPFLIYKSQRQEREFIPGPEEGNFKTFVENIAGKKDKDRLSSLRTMLGYLMHDYYEYKRRAINITDSSLGDSDEGRTGKTLLLSAIGKIKRYCEIPGKSFDPYNKFRYQYVDFDTQIININDVKKYFKLENLNNDITDGVTVEKKNQQPFKIDAKICIASNKTLRVEGASARDRIFEYELTDHYSDKFSPEDEFGEWFFRDWNKDAWAAFDNFMINCIQKFLRDGILRPKAINIIERKLREETNEDFVEFMDGKIDELLKFNTEKKELHDAFLNEYPDYVRDKYLNKQRFFTKYIKKYAEYRGYDCVEGKSGLIRKILLKKKVNENNEDDQPQEDENYNDDQPPF